MAFLDLDVIYYPTPQGGPNFRPKAVSLGGKKQFPYLVNSPNFMSIFVLFSNFFFFFFLLFPPEIHRWTQTLEFQCMSRMTLSNI